MDSTKRTPLDYFMKDLPIETRQKLHHLLYREISRTMMGYFSEKEEGYPSFRSMSFTDEDIARYWEVIKEKILEANLIMEEEGRGPLFTDPADSLRTAGEHGYLITARPAEELEKEFGTGYRDYVPERKEHETDHTDG